MLRLLVLASTLLTQVYSVFGSALAPVYPRATECNGFAELCHRSYGNVTFVGAHDSYAVGANLLAANQDQDVTQQLNDGIRLLQLQVLNETGTIELCHTQCSLLDGGTLHDYLVKVKRWLDVNPNEVLTILIVNNGHFQPTAYDAVYRAVGIDAISYSPVAALTRIYDWPSIGSMIDAGKRVVTFLDSGADFTSVPYLNDEFTNIWETAFDVTDTTFNCSIDRSHGDNMTQMYLINHFLDSVQLFGQPSPDKGALNQTNAVSGTGSLGNQVNTCLENHGLPPNFMLVDFYEYGGGSVFEVAATINGVTYNPATPIATPLPTSGVVTSTPLNGASFLDHNQRFACIVSVMAVMIGMLLVL